MDFEDSIETDPCNDGEPIESDNTNGINLIECVSDGIASECSGTSMFLYNLMSFTIFLRFWL